MEQKLSSPFVFYLSLEESLPKTFYKFDKHMKELGFILVPVQIDQLQAIVSSTDQSQIIVISSVSDMKELRLYNEKVRNLLKYTLKSRRLTFMLLSSFSRINDLRNFSMTKNYFFIKYPINAQLLSRKIARYYELKSEASHRWPGGKRAGLGAIV